jgi:hypothetical protein|tara:strand:+ start:3557 stop:4081 length:525 start_codon:yes stop_codon:yes gene_type:complete
MARVFLISLILCNPLFSQENIDPLDSINKNIKKATRLSALVPGLGQVYNKQYWKIPIIFGGYSVIGHYIKFNNDMYQEFRTALVYETDEDVLTVNPYPNFGQSSLERNMDFWRRNRDLLIIFSGVYYLLNIADAHIFAHLKDFDTNDNISLRIKPSLKNINNTNVVGISLNINF